MPLTKRHADLPALLVLLVGIGMLVLVFNIAYHLFNSPVPGLALPVKPGASAPPAANIGVALSAFLRQLLLLAVMTVVGSLTASKGIHLYLAARQAPPNSPVYADKSGQATLAPTQEPQPVKSAMSGK